MSEKQALEDDVRAFKARNRLSYWAATFAIAAVVALLAVLALLAAAAGPARGPEWAARLALMWAPVGFYLAALWFARRLFLALSREGFAFHAAVSRALVQMGWALALGGGISVVGGMAILVTGPARTSSIVAFNAPGLIIAIVGVALIAIGGLVRRAEEVRQRNLSLRAKLDEFF